MGPMGDTGEKLRAYFCRGDKPATPRAKVILAVPVTRTSAARLQRREGTKGNLDFEEN